MSDLVISGKIIVCCKAYDTQWYWGYYLHVKVLANEANTHMFKCKCHCMSLLIISGTLTICIEIVQGINNSSCMYLQTLSVKLNLHLLPS